MGRVLGGYRGDGYFPWIVPVPGRKFGKKTGPGHVPRGNAPGEFQDSAGRVQTTSGYPRPEDAANAVLALATGMVRAAQDREKSRRRPWGAGASPGKEGTLP